MRESWTFLIAIARLGLLGVSTAVFAAEGADTVWHRHVIDNTSKGADGVRLADVNGDGFQDIATGWEEGGLVKVYLNPGPARVKTPWPSVIVGRVKSPEDAVFADVNADGAVDVVSSCEGSEQTVYVHWAPKNPADYLDASQWRTEALPASKDRMKWMFIAPTQAGAGRAPQLFAGAKGEGAAIGIFKSGDVPGDLSGWTWHEIHPLGWLMSLVWTDMDGDGDQDLLLTDRKGENRGCHWLRNPGPAGVWRLLTAGLRDYEVMFLATGDVDGDNMHDIVVACKDAPMMRLERNSDGSWDETAISMPENTGTGKGVGLGDMDGDGLIDIVFTCEHAENKRGVMYMARQEDGTWVPHDISGLEGIKFDRVELIDLDADGDLDVLTCEERTGLGVIWYENPLK
jgi:hypothetical protein